MRSTTLARRYAGALFDEARRLDEIDTVESDLGLMSHTLQTIPDLRQAITHPLIPSSRKKEIITRIFESSAQLVTLQFLCLLIDKRREEILEDVEIEFVQLANDFRNIQPVMVTSAIPLTAEEQSALAAKLNQFTGKQVELLMRQDESIIGGMTIKIGDTVIDGSVRGYLADLENRMLERA